MFPRRRLYRSLLAVLVIATAVPAGAASTTPEAVVLTSVEDMFTRPSSSVDVTSQAFLGQNVKILETRGSFSRIETPDRYKGWVRSAALRRYTSRTAPRYATHGRAATVVSLIANVYRAPSVTTARPLIKAPFTTTMEVAGEQIADHPNWLSVRLPSGAQGFVQAGDVRVDEAGATPPPASGQALVETARRFMGLPYLWGGMTPWGVDCSGFVGAVYRSAGTLLPRDADLQFDDPKATVIARGDLQAGDLVFFGRTKITHVGLYAGEGRFVHATTHETPRVQESLLDDPYWTELFRGARRPR